MDVLKALKLKSRHSGTFVSGAGWVAPRGGASLTSVNPSNGSILGEVLTCGTTEYERVIRASVALQQEWKNVPAPKRGELVRLIGNRLREKKSLLGTLIAMEMGKIKQEGDGEVQEMIDIADFAIGQSRMLYGNTMHSERPDHRMYEQWHPLGVVGVISAFNFPVAVWAWNAFLAAIAGNTVVWKPSAKTPLCAIAVQQICHDVAKEAGYPDIFSLFIPSETTIAERFATDVRVPLISFTGSSQVGRRVESLVAQRFGRSLLECSGNNAIIVDASADLDLAVPAIVFGAVGTAGQRCTTTRRLIVHHKIYDRLVPPLVHAYQQVRIGDPLKRNTLMGPLIDDAAVTAFQNAITSATETGGNILAGGNVLRRRGHFVEPTLIAMDKQHVVVHNETFAPILYVMKYRDIEQAIKIQNEVPQGLSSAIFTRDLRQAELFLSARGSDCGIANVNIGTSGAEIGGAFGGEKETGGGREAGSDCWKNYMRRQTNTTNWSDALPLAQGIRFMVGKR